MRVILRSLLWLILCFERNESIGDWIRAWPRKLNKPSDDYCFPRETKRWSFNPTKLLPVMVASNTFSMLEGIISNDNARRALIQLIKTYTEDATRFQQSIRFTQYPKHGWVAEPLQNRDKIPISLHMLWDTETGTPSENKMVGDTWFNSQCQQYDQPASPPPACLMLLDHSTQRALPCNGSLAAFFLQGGKGSIPLTPSVKVTELAKADEVYLLPTLPDSFAAIVTDPNHQYYQQANSFCCTQYAVPTTTKSGTFTQEWEMPYMKIFLAGNFTLKISNTDLLNTRAFSVAWATTDPPIETKPKPPPPPPTKDNSTGGNAADAIDANMFGHNIKCPMEAQEGGDIGAEDCSAWLVEDDGKKITYQSPSAFSLANQRRTYFSDRTETIVLKKAQCSTFAVGLFDGLQSLKYLDLSYNLFRDLPALGLASAFIEELDVSWNQLQTLNIYTLRDMVRLRVLRAEHNQIRYLEPNVFEMMLLEQLYLRFNLLSELPQGLFTSMPGSMIYMQVLDLRNNNLQTLGDVAFFNYSANLRELLLHSNPMRDISAFYTKLEPFEVLLEGKVVSTEQQPAITPIKCEPLAKLETFSIDFSLGESIEPHMFGSMLSLRYLDIMVSATVASQLTHQLFQPICATLLELHLVTTDAYRIPANFLSACKSLRKIEWSSSGLVSIESFFGGLENLHTLILSTNQIYSLPANVFNGLKNLEHLDLSNNQIEHIHENTFKYTPKLQSVLMSKNQLTFIEQAVWSKLHDPDNRDIPLSQRPKLKRLRLEGNPLQCVPIWMEGPESNWARQIQDYQDLYGPPPAFCTLCGKGRYAATFENAGADCLPCPGGAVCPYDHDVDKGTFPWTIIWCAPGRWVEEAEGLSIEDCKQCPPGHYCPGEGEKIACSKLGEVCSGGCIDKCEQCPKGSYVNDDHTQCLACDRGKYGEDGLRCKPCPAGTYGGSPGMTNASCSGLCAVGHYCPEGSTKPVQKVCPAGTYGDREGLADAWCSGLCEIGTYCAEGSTSRLGTVCPAGRYGEKPGLDGPECSGPCSPEHFCPVGSVSPVNMKCSAGLISRVGDAQCFECAPDHYSNQRVPQCTEKCPGSRSFNVSLIHISGSEEICSTCPLGSYNLTLNPGGIYEVSECRQCPPGTYNNKWRSVSVKDCIACPINTWSAVPGIESKYLCNKCPLGTFSFVTGATSEDTCKRCPPGKYFHEGYDLEVSRDMDIVCHLCPMGSWTDGSDGICHLCQLGFWSNQEGRSKPCYQVCDDGYLCPVGSHSPRMFVVPQGNQLPMLEHAFWIGSFLCFVSAFTVIIFRAV